MSAKARSFFITGGLIVYASTLLYVVPGCGSGSNTGSDDSDLSPISSTFQPASVVIGQGNFTSGGINRGSGENLPDASSLDTPYGNPAVGSLFVPDYGNSRVLGYKTIPATNGASADFVLGQSLFTNTACNASAAGMCGPQTAVVHQGKLLVVDFVYNRVLIWNAVPASSVPADVVVGQADMFVTAAACGDSSLNSPESIAIIDDKLVVADSGNHRVLVWNTIPTQNGAPADLVMGQPDFITCTAGVSAQSFNYPTDLVSNGIKLALADRDNHRVLIWNQFPICTPTAGQTNCAAFSPANVVLGQPDFVSGIANNLGLSANSFNQPFYLATNGTNLAVSDSLNNRVLIWNQFPNCTPLGFATNCASTTPADVVLGQPNFASNIPNNDGTGVSSINSRSFNYPTGISYNGPQQLFITDNKNNRVLIINAP